jgi:hypothetical protein
MFSSNSSEMEDQIVMSFLGIIDEAMSVVQAEEAMTRILRRGSTY